MHLPICQHQHQIDLIQGEKKKKSMLNFFFISKWKKVGRKVDNKIVKRFFLGKTAISNESITKTGILRARQFRKIKHHIQFFCHMIFGNLSWELFEFSPLN